MAVRSARNKHWHLNDAQTPTAHSAIADLGCNPVVANLLYQRLYLPEQPDRFSEDVAAFLNATYPHALHDPLLLKDMNQASKRIAQAITAGESIAVYGDFDTDGVTAVTLLMQVIPAMGGQLRPYIPHREREGYGLNIAAVEQLASEGVTLLITVDCGISNHDEIAHAKNLGIDVVVTDHHRPPPTLPPAYAIINPKQPGCTYPFDQLVGVGIAFKLVQALRKQGLRHTLRGRDMLDVVALGTVADMGPLRDENRILVKAGLQALHMTERPGLRALVQSAGVAQDKITATTIGFMLGPRINAAGRLDDAVLAYNLLLSDNLATAQTLAQQLNQKNRERQQITREVMEAAAEQAEAAQLHQQPIILLTSDTYPAGVVGLVAGKLVERWARPVILLSEGDTVSRGSARSIPTFNIFQALSTCTDLFVRFGGHSMAAGFTIANKHISELETRLLALAQRQLTTDLLQPTIVIDSEIALDTLTWDLHRELTQLEPFGQANQQPVFLSRNVTVVETRAIGSEQQHLRLTMTAGQQSRPRLEAIAFGLGHLAEPLRRHPQIDVVYTLETNVWQNVTSLQLNVKDFRRARS